MADRVDVADLAVNFVSTGETGVQSALQSISGGLLGMLGPAGIAAGAVIAATVGIAGASVKMAADFQESMTQLVTGAGESKANLGLVSQGILSLARDTGESTSQLAAGMYMIESAGYHGAAGLDILKASAEGAKVGNADLGTVADATTTILKDYPNVVNGASGAVNTLIATVANGKTHMQDLAQALAMVLPTASAAGVGLNDVMGAMATMTGEGVPAANAATYLRQTLIALEAPSTAAKKALESVGLSSAQVATDIHSKGLPATLQEITDAVGKKFPVGSAAYVQAIKDISGGSKTMQGMLDLTGQHMATFQQNVKNVAGAVKTGGTSITGWTEVQGDFNQVMARAREVMETAFISLGTHLLPVLTQLGNFLLSSVLPALQRFGSFLQANVLPALAQVGQVIAANVWPAFQQVGSVVVSQLVPALAKLWAAIGPVLLPVLKTLGTLLVADVVISFQIMAKTVTVAVQVLSGIITVVAAVVNAIRAFIGGIGPAWTAFWNGLHSSATTATNGVQAAVMGAWNAIVSATSAFIANVRSFFVNGWNTILGFLGGVWQNILGGVSGFLSGVRAFFVNGFNAVVGAVAGAITAVIGWFTTAYNHSYLFQALVGLVVGYFMNLWHDLTTIGSAIVNALTAAWNAVSNAARAAWSLLVTIVTAEITLVRNVVTTVGTAIVNALSAAWNAVSGAARAAWGLIVTVVTTDINLVRNIVTTVAAAIGAVLSAAWNAIVAAARAAWALFVAVINGEIGAVRAAVGAVVNALKAPFAAAGTFLLQIGRDIIQGLINGIGSMLGAVGNAIGNVAGSIKNGITSVLGIHSPSTVFAEYGQQLAAGLVQGFAGANPAGGVTAALSGLTGGSLGSLGLTVQGSALGPLAGGVGSGSAAVPVNLHIHVAGHEVATAILPDIRKAFSIGTGYRG